MAASGSQRFDAVKDEFEQVLGDRLTSLGRTVRSARAILDDVAAQGASDLTEDDYAKLADQLSELLDALR